MTLSRCRQARHRHEGDVVTIRGVVDDIEDLEAVLAMAALVDGVSEVRDETEVAGL